MRRGEKEPDEGRRVQRRRRWSLRRGKRSLIRGRRSQRRRGDGAR
jgi:hypothetical protein